MRGCDEAARVALYPQASRRVHALPQPRRQPVTHLRRAVVLPLNFPTGDKPAPIRPDHNNGPVTASTVPAHDPSGEADEHHAE